MVKSFKQKLFRVILLPIGIAIVKEEGVKRHEDCVAADGIQLDHKRKGQLFVMVADIQCEDE